MDQRALAEQFELQRPRLRAVAYRMLGSLAEADDAIQDAWLRASRAGAEGVDNIAGWLTVIVSRVCLNRLKSRRAHPEHQLEPHLPDPVVTAELQPDPETEALLADSVGLALGIVLDSLSPPERVAFVLHDLFDIPFSTIADLLGRSDQATRQLASRARRRVHDAGATTANGEVSAQRAVVDAFFAAARRGDLEGLLAILHPNARLRSDGGEARPEASFSEVGAAAVAGRALMFANPAASLHPVFVNGAPGVVVTVEGRPFSLISFLVRDGAIIEIDAIADPMRLTGMTLPGVTRPEEQ